MGPAKGSYGARVISELHKGSHEHDKKGGFAANIELAREAGKKGGEAVKKKYGFSHYSEIGSRGGSSLVRKRGSSYFRELSLKGHAAREKNKELRGE